MDLPQTIYRDRNKIEAVNDFIIKHAPIYQGYPVDIAEHRLKLDLLGAYGIKIEFIHPIRKDEKISPFQRYVYNKIFRGEKRDYKFNLIIYKIEVSNKRKELLLEKVSHETSDIVKLKINYGHGEIGEIKIKEYERI